MILLTALIIGLLIAINALYVAAEFAAVSVRHSSVQTAAAGGNRLALRLLPILADTQALDRYIAACQVGITLSSLVLGAYGQSSLAVWLGALLQGWTELPPVAIDSLAAGLVLVGLTVLQVVLGELVPKSLALQFPLQTALYTVQPLRWSLKLLAGFILVLNGSGNAILRMLRVPPGGHRHIHSPDEIQLLLAESSKGGLLPAVEHQRLRQALLLSQRSARQLMVPRHAVSAISLTAPTEEVLRLAIEGPYTRLPVYREHLDDIAGILHTKDLVSQLLDQGAVTDLEPLLRPVVYAPETVSADRLLALLREKQSHQAIVVDEFGGVAGLVTLEDILTGVLGTVGDEFKSQGPMPERLADGRVRLPGLLRLEQTESWTGVAWQGHCDTVSGRIMEILGRLPQPGEQLRVDGVEVEIERVAGNLIVSVLAIPFVAPAGDDQ